MCAITPASDSHTLTKPRPTVLVVSAQVWANFVLFKEYDCEFVSWPLLDWKSFG